MRDERRGLGGRRRQRRAQASSATSSTTSRTRWTASSAAAGATTRGRGLGLRGFRRRLRRQRRARQQSGPGPRQRQRQRRQRRWGRLRQRRRQRQRLIGPGHHPGSEVASERHASGSAPGQRRPARARRRGDGASPRTGTPAERNDGAPTLDNPGYTLALPGPAPIGVPNFFIEKFRIPPFLLSIYQAAGTEYGVPWQVLAAINEIETDYGRNLRVSSAGRDGLDAVHPLVLAGLRRGRQRRQPQGPLQPGRRDLRRRALPAGRRRRGGPAPRDLRLQPRRLVRGLGDAAGQADRRPAG